MPPSRQPTSRADRGTFTGPATNHGRNDSTGGPSKSKSPLAQGFQTAPDRQNAMSPPTQGIGSHAVHSDKGAASGSHGARASNFTGSNNHVSSTAKNPNLVHYHAGSSRQREGNIDREQGIEWSIKKIWLDTVRALVVEVTEGRKSPFELSRSHVRELMEAAHEMIVPDDEEFEVLRILGAEYRGEHETAQRLEQEYRQPPSSIPWSYEPRKSSSRTSWYIEDGQFEDI